MTRMLRVLVLCVLGLGLAGCGKIQEELAASQNPFPKSSPLHAPVDRVTRKLIHEPAYLERMKGLKSGQAQEMGAMLAMNGLGRLELPMLERRALLVGQLLQKLPEAQCGEIAKATTPAEVSPHHRTHAGNLGHHAAGRDRRMVRHRLRSHRGPNCSSGRRRR
jgi:hypothetical protein